MKIFRKLTLLVLFVLLIGVKPATASFITLEAPDRVSAGSNFEVTVILNGLVMEEILAGAFSFTIGISSNELVQFLPGLSSFGGALGDSQLGESVVGVDSQMVGQGTLINVFEVSLLTFSELLTLQGGTESYPLFTLALNALPFPQPGNNVVGISVFDIELSDNFGLPIFPSSPDTVDTFVTLVPEPWTLSLICAGLIAIAGTRRKNLLPSRGIQG